MNLLDAHVTKILSEPYFKHNKWWVNVEYLCWGLKSKTQLMFEDKETANNISVGYKFLC